MPHRFVVKVPNPKSPQANRREGKVWLNGQLIFDDWILYYARPYEILTTPKFIGEIGDEIRIELVNVSRDEDKSDPIVTEHTLREPVPEPSRPVLIPEKTTNTSEIPYKIVFPEFLGQDNVARMDIEVRELEANRPKTIVLDSHMSISPSGDIEIESGAFRHPKDQLLRVEVRNISVDDEWGVPFFFDLQVDYPVPVPEGATVQAIHYLPDGYATTGGAYNKPA